MKVTKDGKTLYHIQNMNITGDSTPYDLFIWCSHFPNDADIEKAVRSDFEGADDEKYVSATVKTALESSEIYAVYTEN